MQPTDWRLVELVTMGLVFLAVFVFGLKRR